MFLIWFSKSTWWKITLEICAKREVWIKKTTVLPILVSQYPTLTMSASLECFSWRKSHCYMTVLPQTHAIGKYLTNATPVKTSHVDFVCSSCDSSLLSKNLTDKEDITLKMVLTLSVLHSIYRTLGLFLHHLVSMLRNYYKLNTGTLSWGNAQQVNQEVEFKMSYNLARY